MTQAKRTVEMTGYGRLGKPRTGFPKRPQPLEIAAAISTFPPPLRSYGKVENQKQVSHFSTALFPLFVNFKKGGPASELRSSSRLTLRLEYAQCAEQPEHRVFNGVRPTAPARGRGSSSGREALTSRDRKCAFNSGAKCAFNSCAKGADLQLSCLSAFAHHNSSS